MENQIGREGAKWLLRKAGVDPYANRVLLRRLSKRSRKRAREEVAAVTAADVRQRKVRRALDA